MALVQWDPSFELKVTEIDKKHRMLVDSINHLYDSMQAGTEKAALEKQLDKLINYTVFHFAREEHYFDVLGYPDTKNHIAEHDAFEKKVGEFVDGYKSGQQKLTGEVIRFLCDWLVEHIKGSDRHYVSFLLSRGVN